MKILILGISGMLGHKAFEILSLNKKYEVFGTLRNDNDLRKYFSESRNSRNIISGMDALNCIGIIKQLKESQNPLLSIEINSLFPHKLASYVESSNTRLIHISTDCVFSGEKGNYMETDFSDAKDLYGKTKFLGELTNYHNSITLRTSIIGPELKGKVSLLEWFLAQKEKVDGYTNAIYSGFPTVELINILENYIFPNPCRYGVYNVSAPPISKYELLKIIAKVYNKEIVIKPFNDFKTNKTLNCNKFKKDFKFKNKTWFQMITEMHVS